MTPTAFDRNLNDNVNAMELEPHSNVIEPFSNEFSRSATYWFPEACDIIRVSFQPYLHMRLSLSLMLKVERTLYRIPRCLLRNLSASYTDLQPEEDLSLFLGKSSETDPIPLHGVTKEAFDDFLGVLNGK